jgi:hypothetical protein
MREPKWPTETALRVRISTRPWPPVTGAVQHRDAMPGQALAARQQQGLVGLDDEQVVGALLATRNS